jgi:hypothetical protein
MDIAMTDRTLDAYNAAMRGDLDTAQQIANQLSPDEYEVLKAAAFRAAINGTAPKAG